MPDTAILVTCEHGGRRVPAAYRALFDGHETLLASHRGWDPGSLTLARSLAAALHAPLVSSETTRLLVDLNRSPSHPRLFSAVTQALSPKARDRLLSVHYLPHRRRITDLIDRLLPDHRRVIHIAAHSFTPVLDTVRRNAHVGLLYDPQRATERALCRAWQARLQTVDPTLRVRRNYPYRGRADGLTTWLRGRYRADRYLGIELELNQAIAARPAAAWRALRIRLALTLRCALRDAMY